MNGIQSNWWWDLNSINCIFIGNTPISPLLRSSLAVKRWFGALSSGTSVAPVTGVLTRLLAYICISFSYPFLSVILAKNKYSRLCNHDKCICVAKAITCDKNKVNITKHKSKLCFSLTLPPVAPKEASLHSYEAVLIPSLPDTQTQAHSKFSIHTHTEIHG